MIKVFFLLLFIVSISAQNVFKTPSGEKYHLGSCKMVKNVSAKLSLDMALAEGLNSCKICKPPFQKTLRFFSKLKKTSGINSRNQCLGRTKAGTQCKHKTKIGNDFCFQHVPQ